MSIYKEILILHNMIHFIFNFHFLFFGSIKFFDRIFIVLLTLLASILPLHFLILYYYYFFFPLIGLINFGFFIISPTLFIIDIFMALFQWFKSWGTHTIFLYLITFFFVIIFPNYLPLVFTYISLFKIFFFFSLIYY